MRLPPHPNNDESSLVIGAESTISFWIRPSNEEGILFSKQENSSFTSNSSSFTPRF